MKRLIFSAIIASIPALVLAQAPASKAPEALAAPKALQAPTAPKAPEAPNAPQARQTPQVPVTPAVSHAAIFGPAEQTALVKQYCASCHSDRGKAGQLTLASFDAAAAANPDHIDTTEKMIRKLRAGMMPPAGARRPAPEQIAALTEALEARVDRVALVNPNPGSRPFQRLNRAEYGRAVKDMLGIDIDVASLLPADTISNGFDNVADAQNFSTTLMESYLRAAAKVTALAIGDKQAAATETNYRVPKTASQLARVDGGARQPDLDR